MPGNRFWEGGFDFLAFSSGSLFGEHLPCITKNRSGRFWNSVDKFWVGGGGGGGDGNPALPRPDCAFELDEEMSGLFLRQRKSKVSPVRTFRPANPATSTLTKDAQSSRNIIINAHIPPVTNRLNTFTMLTAGIRTKTTRTSFRFAKFIMSSSITAWWKTKIKTGGWMYMAGGRTGRIRFTKSAEARRVFEEKESRKLLTKCRTHYTMLIYLFSYLLILW